MTTLFTPALSEWPEELLYEFHERAAIKIDSHIPVELAEAAAMEETWEGRRL